MSLIVIEVQFSENKMEMVKANLMEQNCDICRSTGKEALYQSCEEEMTTWYITHQVMNARKLSKSRGEAE